MPAGRRIEETDGNRVIPGMRGLFDVAKGIIDEVGVEGLLGLPLLSPAEAAILRSSP